MFSNESVNIRNKYFQGTAKMNNEGMPSNKRNAVTSPKSALLSPHCFLQCHSKEDDPEDFKEQVWCCRFHPKLKHMVATCGGEATCFIDVNTATVKGRFVQPNEKFYTLDWTSVDLNGSHTSNILACGGCLGFIYLIHAEQYCAYGFFKAHSKPVQTMTFVPNHQTLLLSAGNEKKIYLWDIGTPSLPDYNFSQKKLIVFESLEFSPLKLLPLDEEFLLCASEGGLFCWNVLEGFQSDNKQPAKLQRHRDITEIQFPFVDDEPLVDGLTLVGDGVLATKCAQTGVIFLWKLDDIRSELRKRVKLCTVPISHELKWSNTQQCYINIATHPETKTLFAGDDIGSVWIYDCNLPLDSMTKSKKQKPSLLPGKSLPPTKIISWPRCTRDDKVQISCLDKGMVFNEITLNPDCSFLVAVADNNLVCIYKTVE